MENQGLSYEITREETRRRNRRILEALRIILPLGLGCSLLGMVLTGESDRTLGGLYYSAVLFVLTVISRASWVNRLFPYAHRSYHMDDQGLTIGKGKKTRQYPWSEFACFFVHQYPVESDAPTSYPAEGLREKADPSPVPGSQEQDWDIERKVFYLVKKAQGWNKLMKNYVVVYGETENSDQVEKYLALHVSQRKMTSGDDWGLMSFEFK